MKAAVLQITSSDTPADNLAMVSAMLDTAHEAGAGFVLTPEITNCLTSNRDRQREVLTTEDADPTLSGLRDKAASLGIWLSIGSLGLKTGEPDGRFANRSFLIDPTGRVCARYDKIHMFDVNVSETETYRESAAYRPGDTAVVVKTPFATLGLTICYDVRFPYLHRALAHAGAEVILAPAAFSPVTGAAHWEPLLRARAIETGCYVLASAQTGLHPAGVPSPPRSTYGHALIVSPWGEVLADAGTEPGILYVDLDRAEVAKARQRIPALTHDRPFKGP
ncbi:MAG: carbon-nitrogen hydrolase family protein [Rhodobacterales bacterium]|nr:carbon-nitrogen hydrolase family protein [Rhodobacterales bacterium]